MGSTSPQHERRNRKLDRVCMDCTLTVIRIKHVDLSRQ